MSQPPEPLPAALPDDLVSRDGLGRLSIRQPRRGYRFSIDSVLLAFFAPQTAGPVADLGAGCGVLCLLLAARGLAGPFTALEIDPLAAACARANFAAHGLAGAVLTADLAGPLPEPPAAGFGLIVSNPPFGRAGHGHIPPDPSRARARHELALTAADLWSAAARLLAPGGRFALCGDPRRLPELLAGLAGHGLAPRRLRLVHGRAGKPASLALIEAVKGGGAELTVEPPLCIYAEGQSYSEEVAAMYRCLD
ncbi:MAG: methyltransferase [Pseudomonadota bacterium]